MAVAEATAMVLEVADPGTELVSRFVLAPGKMTVAVSVGARGAGRARLRQLRLAGADHAGHQRQRSRRPSGRFTVTMTMQTATLEADT